MRTKKKVVPVYNPIAKTARDVVTLKDPVAARIMDRSYPIDRDFVRSVVNASVMSWKGRLPQPALDAEGNFQATDLDLLSFLVPLAERGAVIEIPGYENRRPRTYKANERRVGTTRFGAIAGLVSNQDVLSFSVRIFDQSIVVRDPKTGRERIGAYRNYLLVDLDGTWYRGWKKIVWQPTAKENAFLTDRGLWSGNTVYFKYYVHPNRKQSIYGAPYLRLKMLSARLADEAAFYRSEVARLETLGLALPERSAKQAPQGDTLPARVKTLDMELDLPPFSGRYRKVSASKLGLARAYERQKLITYVLRPLVQFVIRADEAAFFRFGAKKNFVAPWMTNAKWKSGYRLPRGRIDWKRFELVPGIALRYRLKRATERVAA